MRGIQDNLGPPIVVSRCKRVEKHPRIVTEIAGGPYLLLKGGKGFIRCHVKV